METRERNRLIQRVGMGEISQTTAAGGLERIRQEGADLLTAADEAINRALSGDSEAFLAANRQQGGQ